MTVKADWGATAVADPPASLGFDPLALSSSSAMAATKPATADKPLDLSTPEPQLRQWMGELIRREGNLFDCGTTCPLRDLAESTCSACPVSQADREDGTREEMRLAKLCQIGQEQERVSMLLMTQQHGR